MTTHRKVAVSCHSRAEPAPDPIGGGNPLTLRLSWTPAPDQVEGRLCAGVTQGSRAFILLEALSGIRPESTPYETGSRIWRSWFMRFLPFARSRGEGVFQHLIGLGDGGARGRNLRERIEHDEIMSDREAA